MDIGVWGDSIVYGKCDAEALGWTGRLRKAARPEEDGDVVYDRGVCGDTSSGLLKRFRDELASFIYPLDAVLLAIGVNDTCETDGVPGNRVPLEEFERNISGLVMEAKARVPSVYVIGIANVDEARTCPLPTSSTGKNFRNESIERYNEVLARISREQGVAFVPVFGLLEPGDLADGLHPNAGGYEKLSAAIASAL